MRRRLRDSKGAWTVNLQVLVTEKSFSKNGTSSPVLSDLSFEVSEGSIVCVFGPSGCGKTSLLRIIAGLDTDYQGHVLLDGKPVTHPTRDIGLTVQTLVSYDWLTVAGNMTFGMRYSQRQN